MGAASSPGGPDRCCEFSPRAFPLSYYYGLESGRKTGGARAARGWCLAGFRVGMVCRQLRSRRAIAERGGMTGGAMSGRGCNSTCINTAIDIDMDAIDIDANRPFPARRLPDPLSSVRRTPVPPCQDDSSAFSKIPSPRPLHRRETGPWVVVLAFLSSSPLFPPLESSIRRPAFPLPAFCRPSTVGT